ncbi:MAG: hypothetical protein O3A13_02825 [Proteobacteria bacterium]|nr:hypothetical protein [Pseudomonadota bacterium]
MSIRYKTTFPTMLCLMASAVSVAQTVDQGDLERCAEKASAELKLACFEALTSAGIDSVIVEPGNTDPIDASDVSPVAAKPATEMSRTDAAASGTVATSAKATQVTDEPERNGPIPAVTQSTLRNGPVVEPVESQTDDPPVVVTAKVVEVSKGRYNVLYFHFDDGQVWRQIEGRRFRYPKDGDFEVTISKGLLGDDQLRVEGSGAMTRIRRIQ